MSADRAPGAARRIVGEAISFRSSALLPVEGLRVGAGCVIALVLGSILSSPAVGAAAAGGSLAPGLASLDVERRPRWVRPAATCAAMAVATFVGSATGANPWVRIAVIGLWAGGWGFVVAVEPRSQQVGINAIVALLVFGRFPGPAGYAVRLAGVVAAGGGLQPISGCARCVGGWSKSGKRPGAVQRWPAPAPGWRCRPTRWWTRSTPCCTWWSTKVTGGPEVHGTAASSRDSSSASVKDPGGSRSRAARFAVRCMSWLAGVATPCSRPRRTASPFR